MSTSCIATKSVRQYNKHYSYGHNLYDINDKVIHGGDRICRYRTCLPTSLSNEESVERGEGVIWVGWRPLDYNALWSNSMNALLCWMRYVILPDNVDPLTRTPAHFPHAITKHWASAPSVSRWPSIVASLFSRFPLFSMPMLFVKFLFGLYAQRSALSQIQTTHATDINTLARTLALHIDTQTRIKFYNSQCWTQCREWHQSYKQNSK